MDTHLSSVPANARTRSRGVWVRASRLRFVASLSPVIAVETAAELKFSESFCVSTRTFERKGLRDISISQRRWQWVSHGAAPPPLRTNFAALGARGCGRGYWPALAHHLWRRVNQLLTRFMVKIASDVKLKIEMRRVVSQNLLVQIPQGSWTVLTVILSADPNNARVIFHSKIKRKLYFRTLVRNVL